MDLASIFSDVEPIEQNEGPEPVVRIAYSPDFIEVMGYFRRILVNEEYSERALRLSAEAIGMNAANYTAWQFRRKCIAKLHEQTSEEERKAAWRKELAFCDDQCRNNMKNYQVRRGRGARTRCAQPSPRPLLASPPARPRRRSQPPVFDASPLLSTTPSPTRPAVPQVWFHRRSCVEQIGEADKEMEFLEEILDEDAKNYHAWGHRQWVLRTFSLWSGELAFVER